MAIPRIRPQYLWAAHFFIFFVYLGFLTSKAMPFSIDIAKPFAVVWFGVIMLHTMVAFGAFGGDEPRKREMTEKPKRCLELSDDGELVEVDDSADDEEKRKRLRGE
jgi:hypothetical protein